MSVCMCVMCNDMSHCGDSSKIRTGKWVKHTHTQTFSRPQLGSPLTETLTGPLALDLQGHPPEHTHTQFIKRQNN